MCTCFIGRNTGVNSTAPPAVPPRVSPSMVSIVLDQTYAFLVPFTNVLIDLLRAHLEKKTTQVIKQLVAEPFKSIGGQRRPLTFRLLALMPPQKRNLQQLFRPRQRV